MLMPLLPYAAAAVYYVDFATIRSRCITCYASLDGVAFSLRRLLLPRYFATLMMPPDADTLRHATDARYAFAPAALI